MNLQGNADAHYIAGQAQAQLDGFRRILPPGFAVAHDLPRYARIARLVIEQAQELEAIAVQGMRAAGMSWAEVGAELGVSKQAAQSRYGTNHAVVLPKPLDDATLDLGV